MRVRTHEWYANKPMRLVFGWEVHPTHVWVPNDDILECGDCCVRPYNDEAKQPCPEPGTGGPDYETEVEEAELDFRRRWGG